MRHRARHPVVILTCALALAACGSQPSGDAAATEQSAASARPEPTGTAIPDDFPLSSGMGGAADRIPTSRTGNGLRDLEVCDTAPLRGLGARDRMVADDSGGEAAHTRELVLLGSPEEAAALARSFAELARGCDPPSKDGFLTANQVRESPFGPEPAVTLLQTYTVDGETTPGATVVQVVPAGAALLVTSIYGEWAAADLEAGIAETVDRARDTVSALARFDPVPTVQTVPADFPLGVGLPEDDDETTVSPPSSDGEGMGVVEMCEKEVWPLDRTTGGTRRLMTGALGPEYFDGRELIVHADAGVAAQAMAMIRQAAADCRSIDNQVWTVLDRDTGYDTVTLGLTYDDGLGSSVFQVTRVGSARLMVQTYGEGSLASLDEQADGVTATTGKIVPAMCVFTKTGC